MTIQFRQGGGTRLTGTANTRAVASLAGSVFTTTGTITNAAVGRVIEYHDQGASLVSPTTNKGFYSITAISGATITVRPAPNASATPGGNLSLVTEPTSVLTSTSITSIVVIGATNRAILECSTANFITAGVRPNDKVSVTGHATAANNGAWYVSGLPLDATRLVLRPADGGAGLAASGASGAITIRMGVHRPIITEEPAFSLAYILANAVPVPGPSGGSPNFGSGVIADFIRVEPLAGGARTLYTIDGFGLIDLVQTAADAVWAETNCTIVCGRKSSLGLTGGDIITGTPLRIRTVDSTRITTFRFGTQNGNRYSARDGGVLMGVGLPNTVGTGGVNNISEFFGVYADSFDGINFGINVGSKVTASILRGSFFVDGGTTQESNVYYGFRTPTFEGSGDVQNILIASSDNTAALTGPAEFGGIIVSDDVVLPSFSVVSGTINFLDPRQDFDLNDGVFAGGFSKSYTYNPRHTWKPFGIPVAAILVSVEIVEIVEDTGVETVVFTGTTDVNGLINGGLGVALDRQRGSSINGFFNNSHRITTSGGGFPTRTSTIQLFSAVLQRDYPVANDEELWNFRYQGPTA
ncbi:MAG: hypothetical protein ACREQL_09385 [Candidatus Binatia bacterium]